MSGALGKVSFDNGGAFIRETRREVEAVPPRASARGSAGALRLYAKAPVALGLIAALVGGARARAARADRPASSPSLGLVAGRDADGVLRPARREPRCLLPAAPLEPPAVGWSTDALLGFSSYAWRVKHNVAHHTYTNVDGYDDDITQVPLARFSPIADAASPGTGSSTSTSGRCTCSWVCAGRRSATSGVRAGQRRRERAALRLAAGTSPGVLAGKAIFVHLGARRSRCSSTRGGRCSACTSAFAMVTSLIMATTFQLAHCVEEASFASADEVRAAKPIVGRARGRVDGRLLPAQPGADLDARRAQLPDRASPVPAGAAHALPADRTRSCAATASATASATRRSPRSGPRCARTSFTCARWAGSASRSRSRWARAPSARQAASFAAASYQASSSSQRRIVGPLPRGENHVTVGVVTGSLWAIRWSR